VGRGQKWRERLYHKSFEGHAAAAFATNLVDHSQAFIPAGAVEIGDIGIGPPVKFVQRCLNASRIQLAAATYRRIAQMIGDPFQQYLGKAF
jgi:hypothetical protein